MFFLLIAATVLELTRNGIEFSIDADRETVDPARSVFLTVKMKVPKEVKAPVATFWNFALAALLAVLQISLTQAFVQSLATIRTLPALLLLPLMALVPFLIFL